MNFKSNFFLFLLLLLSSYSYSYEKDRKRMYIHPINGNDLSPQFPAIEGNQESGNSFEIFVLTVDSRDQETCLDTKSKLERNTEISAIGLTEFCKENEWAPYSSAITINNQKNKHIISEQALHEQEGIARQTTNFFFLGASPLGIFFFMPKSALNLEKNSHKHLTEKYIENIKSGPVLDKDDFSINYIGHSYAGASYYVVARHSGLNKMQSFAYNAFMSTVFWEYGVEAFFEPPSIQDLITTPVLGSLLGEAFMIWSTHIQNQGGELFRSKTLGTLALSLMSPADTFFNSMETLFSKSGFLKT